MSAVPVHLGWQPPSRGWGPRRRRLHPQDRCVRLVDEPGYVRTGMLGADPPGAIMPSSCLRRAAIPVTLPSGVRGPILNGGRFPDWPSHRPPPSIDCSYRPTTMPRSAAYAKPGPGQSRPFPPPAPHLGPEHGEVGDQSLADDTGSGNIPRVHAAAAHRKTPAPKGNTTDLFRTRPAGSGQLALAPPRRQVPCTAETRRRSPGHGRVPRPAGDCVNSCCAVPEASRPKKSTRTSGSSRPGSVRSHRTAAHGREVRLTERRDTAQTIGSN
ncbi:hypothetical protein F558DRAFT_03476 [Streptomyces sp. AmelKG-A3]|nr:hypothetical protein GA0115247_127666 [Streptomyces sp. PalvLS-984]SDD16411.1 hypothetical protein F558DRAFT_03476 [Streptomyces sp. AmelKG-A3]